MSDATPIDAAPIDEALSGLSELAACDLRLAKRFCARIEACGDDEDDKAMNLARSYQRMARSYRQTLVVQARLRRELKAEAKADAVDVQAARKAAHAAREAAAWSHRTRVRQHFERVLWDEYEDDDAEAIFNDIEERLADLAGDDGFLDMPVATLIARLTEEFGIGAGADEADEAEPPPPPGAAREAEESPVSDAEETAPIGLSAEPVLGPAEGRTRGPSGRVPPEGEPADPPAAAPPEPDPPPRPPDPPPEPYIPPWERNPHARYPGGSGW